MAEERLQKILARAGVASRRAAELLIVQGHVRVNGEVVTELGARANPASDRIEVDGKPIARESHVYYLVHKPRSMVTTLKDPEGRPTLSELLIQIPERVYPVGRLDFHTSGALLVTNDGDLAQALLHPSREVPKTYVAKLNALAENRLLEELRKGVQLDDGYRTQAAKVTRLRDEDDKSWLEITITEGKNRQIHRMIEAIGLRVQRLSRLSFAGLSTDNLRPGSVRPLEPHEIAALRREYLGIEPEPAARGRSGAPGREQSRAAVRQAPRAALRETPRPSAREASRASARDTRSASTREAPRAAVRANTRQTASAAAQPQPAKRATRDRKLPRQR